MRAAAINELDYLAARVHGRRGRLADAEKLQALCRSPDLSELGKAICPEGEFRTTAEFQRRLTSDLAFEVSGYLKHLEGAGADLLAWVLVRFQIENIKVLLRAVTRRIPLPKIAAHLISLPGESVLNTAALASATSVEDFADKLPLGAPQNSLRQALLTYREEPCPFFLEGALDRGYFRELLVRAEELSGEDREVIRPIILQEVDGYHLLLVARGKFQYEVSPDLLRPLHVRGSGIPSDCFGAMLAAPDITGVAQLAAGKAIDGLRLREQAVESAALTPSLLEAMVWQRFLRLSNRAFRRSHMGLGAVVGYLGIRRVEAVNLITISEAIARGVGESVGNRLVPRGDLEPAYV